MINFVAGNVIIPDAAFRETLLSLPRTPTLKQALENLSRLDCEPLTVISAGEVNSIPTKYAIRVVPVATNHPLYRNGNGVTILFETEEQLNNSFELSKAFLKDKCIIKVLNISGVPLTKGQMVYQTGFDATTQLPTVALASASSSATSVVFGAVAADISDGGMGSIVNQGSIIVDTSSFTAEGDDVFLGDTPGSISNTAGTTTVVVGKVLCIATEGSISVFSGVTSGSNTGSGVGGAGVPDTSRSFSNQTTDFNIANDNANQYTIFANLGAGAEITGTVASGMPVDFEFHAYVAEANTFNLVPSGGEDIINNGVVTSNGITSSNIGQHAWLKKITSTRWANLVGAWGNVAVIQEATASDLTLITVDLEMITMSTDWVIEAYLVSSPYDESMPSTTVFLGSVDETEMFADGSSGPDNQTPMVLKVINNDASNDLDVVSGFPITFTGTTTPSGYSASFQSNQSLVQAGAGNFIWLWLVSDGTIRSGGASDPNGPNITFAEAMQL